MKKYIPTTSRWMKRSNIVYLFFAWNAAGMCLYQWFKGYKSDDEEWTKLSGTQKYLKMMGTTDTDKVHYVHVKGLTVAENKATTMNDVMTPKSDD